SMVSLPLTAFKLVESPEPAYIARGFGTAAVLLVLVLVLFVVARVLGGRGPGRLTRRQEHRRVKASRRDIQRYSTRVATATPTTGTASTGAASTSSSTRSTP
ncbi:hypothetical protein ACWD25_33340, partial [Streptomyces sp. NPDC002920]